MSEMPEACQILVVDDDIEDHFIMQEYFSEIGFTGNVGFSENGQLALHRLEAIHDDRALPRLIVLDLNMPILSGTETLMELKRSARYRNIPVIIFSTSENETEKRKCLSLGAIDYMVKPLTLEECLSTVRRFSAFVD